MRELGGFTLAVEQVAVCLGLQPEVTLSAYPGHAPSFPLDAGPWRWLRELAAAEHPELKQPAPCPATPSPACRPTAYPSHTASPQKSPWSRARKRMMAGRTAPTVNGSPWPG